MPATHADVRHRQCGNGTAPGLPRGAVPPPVSAAAKPNRQMPARPPAGSWQAAALTLGKRSERERQRRTVYDRRGGGSEHAYRSAARETALRMAGRCLLAACVLTFAAPQSRAQTVEDRARAAATATQQRTGSSDALRGNYLTPGLSGEAISTIDQSRTFTPAIACQKTTSLLEVLIQPGGTGDITSITLLQDTNLDGSLDRSGTISRPISGICANGVVSCEPGTWTQCHFLAWTADAGRALSLAEVAMPELAGCYCVNNSCGANLVWGNLDDVLKDLGGGMIGALTTSDPRVGVAQAQVNGPLIRYVGAEATACADETTIAQVSYRANPATIQADAANASTGSSIFQSLAASGTGAGKAQQMRSCAIKREVMIADPSIEDVISRTSGGYSEVRTGTGAIDFLMGSPADDSLKGGSCTLFDFRMTLHVSQASRITAARLVRYFADDWVQFRIDGALLGSGPSPWTTTGLPPGKCEKKATYQASPNLDIISYLTEGDHEVWLRAAVADGGEAFAQLHVEVDENCTLAERVVDQCAGYAAQSQCTLSSEAVDGVETFRNAVATGLRPLPQTRTFGADRCAMSITRDFFNRERQYACVTDTAAMTAPDLSRGAYIIDHSTETLLADRTRAADGSIVSTTRAFQLPDRGTVAACEPVCKTRAPAASTAATPTGVTGALLNEPAGWDTFYHSCSAQNVCPLGSGEEIVSDCGCLDDFPEAVVMMQSVRLAGADMVCTSSAP